jgi:hypothetical protein
VALLLLLVLQNSPPSSGVTSPFTNSTAKIESVSKNTTAANYNVGLKYSQQPIKKGEPAFFMVDMSSITNGEYIRMRHVDCDFVILRDKQEMYKLSSQYGEPQFHSINGIMLASFDFKDVGTYTISIKITGELFIPISPVFANFSVVVAQEPDGNKRITIT